MQGFTSVVIIAILIQAIVEGVKGALCKWDWISLGLGAVICPAAGIDMFQMAGVPLAVPFAGAVLTGFVAGRGAAFVFDVIKRIKDQDVKEFVTNITIPSEITTIEQTDEE